MGAASWPRPGGQAYPNLDHLLYTLGWLKLIVYTERAPA